MDVYVIDTGINVNHVDFEGRASRGKTIPQNDVGGDGNDHGPTAPVPLVPASTVLPRLSTSLPSRSWVPTEVVPWLMSLAVLCGLLNRLPPSLLQPRHKGSVANMSLGGGKSLALDDAVNRAVDSGMHFAVAAGNDNRDACAYSPAAADKAVTVGASTLGYFSNYGECVDVFAPGKHSTPFTRSGF